MYEWKKISSVMNESFFKMTNQFCIPCTLYAKGERLNTANSELASVCHSSQQQ